MLKLKDHIKESVSIFFERGRKVTFDINTPAEEYQYYQDLGFRIFECSKCLKEFCNCSDENLIDSAQEEPNNQAIQLTQDNSDQEPQESQDAQGDNVQSTDLERILDKLDHEVSQDSPDATESNQTDQDLEYTLEELYAMKLTELRALFPDVKAKTKKKFIEILHNEEEKE